MRKRVIASGIIVAIFLFIFGGAYFWYKSNYGTENYYTQIINQGTKIVEKDDSGSQVVDYMYHQPIYDKMANK